MREALEDGASCSGAAALSVPVSATCAPRPLCVRGFPVAIPESRAFWFENETLQALVVKSLVMCTLWPDTQLVAFCSKVRECAFPFPLLRAVCSRSFWY